MPEQHFRAILNKFIVADIVPASLSLIAMLLSSAAYAQVSQTDIAEAIQPYPRSEVVATQTTAVADYPVALGEMKKIRGLWAPERERRLAGNIQRLTLLIPEGHSPQEAFDFYEKKMRNVSARVLYRCVARNCGSSNAWANELFHIKQLYGLDQQQSYAAYELLDEQGFLHYIAIYTVIRGNKRVYAHTEWLQTRGKMEDSVAPGAKEVSSYFTGQGYYSVNGLRINNGKVQLDDEHLQVIVKAILANSRVQIRVVGHNYADAPIELQVSESTRYAEQFIEALVQNGIPAQRLQAYGVGSLAPAGKGLKGQRNLIQIDLVVSD